MLYLQIFSHLTTPPQKKKKKNAQKSLFPPHAMLLYEKSSAIFCWEERRHYAYLQIFFHFLKFALNFCGTNYDLSSKITKSLF